MEKLMLAIDDTMFPLQKGTCLYLSKPDIREEPVLRPSAFESNAPDNCATHFYGTVLYENDVYRMWYYAVHYGKNPDWDDRMMQQIAKIPPYMKGDCQIFQGPLCYAESKDGLHFEKPALRQMSFKGSYENNMMALPHAIVSAALVIRDDDEQDPARRYKMVYQYFPDQCDPPMEELGKLPTIALAVSPDGLQWTVTQTPFINQFVEPCSFYKHDGKYIINYHMFDDCGEYYSEGGHLSGRTGCARWSYDFDHWEDLWEVTFAPTEPEDPSLRGIHGEYDQIHLGVGGATFGNVCVGIYGMWHGHNVLTDFGSISGDLGLVLSNDGIHYREPVKGVRFIKREDSPCEPVPGFHYNTILCQGNGILNVGDQTLIYYGKWRNSDGGTDEDAQRYYSSCIALATLPRDRWGSLALNPKAEAGRLCTPEMPLGEGTSLYVNAEGAENIQVSLLHEDLTPIPGFEFGVLEGTDPLRLIVVFPGQTSLPDKARIHFSLKRGKQSPAIYAAYLVSGEQA